MHFLFFFTVLLFAAPVFAQQTDSVYTVVDVPAEFPGGNHALLKWIGENVSYPMEYRDIWCDKLNMRFIVETDGRLTEITNVRPCEPDFDSWSVALIAKMPNWKPALVNGTPVRSSFDLPIRICFN